MSEADRARERLRQAIARVAAGDRAALEQVYRATHVKLYGICLRILGDSREAEDALQEVYLNLWRNAGRFDPGRASPISWLASFARNRAIDLRRTGKVRAGAVPESAAAMLPDPVPLAEEQMIDAQRTARIHHCLDTLEERQRGAIRTAFFEGRSYSELAREQDVPLGTMKSLIRRGLARLKACLDTAA